MGDSINDIVIRLTPVSSLPGKLEMSYRKNALDTAEVFHNQERFTQRLWLLQTVFFLHEAGDLCHLDISSSNVMLCTDQTDRWDSIRLLDFGFCQPCHPVWCGDAAYEIRDVYPQGTTPPYAAPEVLAALQVQLKGAHSPDNFINGPSADLYSAGMVLYEYLTGDLPFAADHSSEAGTAPSHVQDKSAWECYQAYRQVQQSWVRFLNTV